MKLCYFLSLLALLAPHQLCAEAQEATSEEIVQKLKRSSAVSASPGFRQLPWGSKGIAIDEGVAPPSIDLYIQFEFDSAKLTSNGIRTLRSLANALIDQRLLCDRFKIAGHTDAKGTEQYNQDLSERRAQAVRSYLVVETQLKPDKFDAVGFGKTQPLDTADPEAAINRRVQIVNLGPMGGKDESCKSPGH